MDSYRAWLSTARDFLETAKLALGAGLKGPAYFNAAHSGELALKSLLVNLGYSEQSIHGHDEIVLFKKIKSSGQYPQTLTEEIEPLIMPSPEDPSYNISHTDIYFGDGERKAELQCESGEAPNTKYPINSVAPSEYLTESDANTKIILCKKLISIIETYFSPEHFPPSDDFFCED